MNMNINKLQPM